MLRHWSKFGEFRFVEFAPVLCVVARSDGKPHTLFLNALWRHGFAQEQRFIAFARRHNKRCNEIAIPIVEGDDFVAFDILVSAEPNIVVTFLRRCGHLWRHRKTRYQQQHAPGHTWARQAGIRIIKDFNKRLGGACAVEISAATTSRPARPSLARRLCRLLARLPRELSRSQMVCSAARTLIPSTASLT